MKNKKAYFIIGVLIIGALIFREQPPPLRTVLYKSHIISLLRDGNIEALRTSNWKKDKQFSKALQQYNPEFLFSDSKTLAMINKEKAFMWSDKKVEWVEIGKLPHTEETTLDILMSDNRLFVIYPSKIVEPLSNRTYTIPDLWSLSKTEINRFRLLSVYAGKNELWFGTGYGKKGGDLLILNIESGNWNQIHHIDRCINSFTEDESGTIWVVWVKNNLKDGHMEADSVLSSLSSDGMPKGYNGFMQDRYMQAIAYNKYDSLIYGVDRNRVVRFKSNIVEAIADLGNIRYFRDDHDATGVLPAIDDLLIVDKDKFVIPHKINGLFLYESGKIRKLEESKSTAYWLKTGWAKFSRLFGRLKEKV